MKKWNAQRWSLLAILFVLLTNCTAKPPDVPVCEHMGQRLATDPATGHLILKASPTCMKQIAEVECGHCIYIISGKEIFVGEDPKYQLDKKPWSKLRQESIMVPSVESYAPLSTYIINACKQMNCNNDVDKFRVKLGSLHPTVVQ